MSKVQKPKLSTNGYLEKSPNLNLIFRTPIFARELFAEIAECLISFLCWLLYAAYCIGENLYLTFNKPEPQSVKGEKVLITGTGHGIGRELAYQYAEAGATVIGWDINQKENDKTMKEIQEKYNIKSYTYVCDVGNRESVLETAEKVQQDVGEVSIVIANAGIMPCHPIDEHTVNEIQKIIDINVMQLFWLIEAFLPSMKKRNKGHIVGLSSIAGLLGCSNLVPYCASKFAVRGLLESLREDLRRNPTNNIHTTTIYPFIVDTGLCKHPVNRFSSLMRILPPKKVARCIMMAQRTNKFEASVPNHILQALNLLRLFPDKAIVKMIDVVGTRLDAD